MNRLYISRFFLICIFSYLFLCLYFRKPYSAIMNQFKKQELIIFWIIIFLLGIGAYFAAKNQWFSIQHTSQSSEKTSLESDWWLAEWALQDIQWKILVWPYRDLRKQRYTFMWYPKTLQFWLYNFTFDDAKRFFQELGVNGTKVQWIVESQQFASKDNQFADLLKWFSSNPNVTIIPDERLWVEFQHAKTFLGDDTFIIQTANITYSSFNKNREVFFFGTDTWLLVSLHQLFYNDWMSQPTKKDALHPNLIVCPFNCRQRIESLLEHAHTSIVMYQQYIADDGIQNILRAKHDAWLDIKIILWDMWDSESKWNASDERFYQYMWSSIKKQASPYVHAKAILIDNQFLLVWSMNMSDTSLDKNREIGVLLVNQYQIEKLMNMFMKDWSK